jgi:hypothetical protein
VEIIAQPLSVEEENLFEQGRSLFNEGKYWHAHESWEDLWNMLKKREATQQEILLIQGLIQTAALLFHYEKGNLIGVQKQWEKLEPKLTGWGVAWGIDVNKHLHTIKTFTQHNGTALSLPEQVQI